MLHSRKVERIWLIRGCCGLASEIRKWTLCIRFFVAFISMRLCVLLHHHKSRKHSFISRRAPLKREKFTPPASPFCCIFSSFLALCFHSRSRNIPCSRSQAIKCIEKRRYAKEKFPFIVGEKKTESSNSNINISWH